MGAEVVDNHTRGPECNQAQEKMPMKRIVFALGGHNGRTCDVGGVQGNKLRATRVMQSRLRLSESVTVAAEERL
jgi:hypothetical protein